MADKRPTLTLKGYQFTPEFRVLINEAAKREGLTLVEWAFQSMAHAAQQPVRPENRTPIETRVGRMEEMLSALMESFPTAPDDSEDKSGSADPLSAEEREALRIKKRAEFIDLGVDVETYSDGLILVNGKYVVSLLGRKWRVKGKGKWYWYKTPRQFVRKHIEGGE